MTDGQGTPVVQAAPVEQTVETTAPVTTVPPVAPAAPAVSAETAPPQAEQAPKGKDAQARINQLTAKYKLTEEALDTANAEIARLKATGTQVPAEPNNPYAPAESSGEAEQEDLEGLPPVVRKMVEEHAQEKAEREKAQKLTEWEQTVGKAFDAYPELAGAVDDSAIALELKTRRVPLFNADLVFASQALPVVRSQLADARKRVAELEAELHKDTVAAPRNGSTITAPPDGTEKVYAPGEKMAEARRKAATQH